MNAQLKQQIDEKLEHLSETHIAEVLDFVQFLENKERQPPAPQQASIDEALALLRQIVKTPAKGRLGALQLDLTGYTFNRDEANER
jgi:DNA-binding TFAR19-related protein (PDSD5 family)